MQPDCVVMLRHPVAPWLISEGHKFQRKSKSRSILVLRAVSPSANAMHSRATSAAFESKWDTNGTVAWINGIQCFYTQLDIWLCRLAERSIGVNYLMSGSCAQQSALILQPHARGREPKQKQEGQRHTVPCIHTYTHIPIHTLSKQSQSHP